MITGSPNPFLVLAERKKRRVELRVKLNQQLQELAKENEEDEIALKVLREMYPNGFDGVPAAAPEPPPAMPNFNRVFPLAGAPVVAHEQAAQPKMPAKDMLLNIVREAYPTGLSAKQLRGRAMLKYGVEINPNTLTVSMMRHAEKKCVRCEKKLWYYVRDTDRAASLNGHAAGAQERQAAE